MPREISGWNPNIEGEKENKNPDNPGVEAVEESADDFATGADSEYNQDLVLPEKRLSGLEAKIAQAKEAEERGDTKSPGNKNKQSGFGVNARSGGLGLGVRAVKLSTTHGIRQREAGEYGRQHKEVEKRDKNKAAVEDVLKEFGRKDSFRLEVSNNDRTKFFLKIPEKSRAFFTETDTLEKLLVSLRKFLEGKQSEE